MKFVLALFDGSAYFYGPLNQIKFILLSQSLNRETPLKVTTLLGAILNSTSCPMVTLIEEIYFKVVNQFLYHFRAIILPKIAIKMTQIIIFRVLTAILDVIFFRPISSNKVNVF